MLITDSDSQISLLTTPCPEFDFDNPIVEPRQLATDLIAIMYKHNGLGLAANQCGILTRVFVMRGPEEKGNFAIFNPRFFDINYENLFHLSSLGQFLHG